MKLPDINYNRIQLPRGSGPELAGVNYRSKQQVHNAMVDLGDKVGELKRDYDVAKASSDLAGEVNNFQRTHAGKMSYTPDEVRDLGLDNRVKVTSGEFDEDGVEVERKAIPAYEVFPLAYENVMSGAISRHANSISDTKVRSEWAVKAQEIANEDVLRVVTAAEGEAYKYSLKVMAIDAGSAQRDMNFEGAASIINAMPIPQADKDVLLLDNSKKKETESLRVLVQQGDVESMEEQLTFMGSDAYKKGSSLTGDEQESQRGYLKQAIRATEAQDKRKKEELYKLEYQQFWEKFSASGWNVGLIPNDKLKPADARAAYSFARMMAENGAIKTDTGVWVELNELKINDPQAFVDTDFAQYVDRLSQADIKGFSDDRNTILSTASPQYKGATDTSILAGGAAILNLDYKGSNPKDEDVDRYYRLQTYYHQAVAAAQAESGKELGSVEKQKIMDNLVLQQEVNVPGMIWGKNKTRISAIDIPPSFFDKAYKDAQDRNGGAQPTTQQVYDSWLTLKAELNARGIKSYD